MRPRLSPRHAVGWITVALILGAIFWGRDLHWVATHYRALWLDDPRSLSHCWFILDRRLSPDSRKAIREADDSIEFHFGLGMSIRNRWGLWGQSPLRRYLVEMDLGSDEPDSHSDLVIASYMAHLKEPELTEPEFIARERKRNASMPVYDPTRGEWIEPDEP